MDPDMSKRISVTATDSHELDAWRSDPTGTSKGGIVILHAIYGLTNLSWAMCATFGPARDLRPLLRDAALYDRIAKNTVHGYDQTDKGRDSYVALNKEQILADVAGCAAALRPGPVAISGFCTGGSWAWVAAQELPFDASVNCYGSHVHQRLDYKPACPTIMHYGDADKVVPIDGVKAIQAANPDVTIHIYPGAGHAFFNPEQISHDPDRAGLLLSRSVAFLEEVFS